MSQHRRRYVTAHKHLGDNWNKVQEHGAHTSAGVRQKVETCFTFYSHVQTGDVNDTRGLTMLVFWGVWRNVLLEREQHANVAPNYVQNLRKKNFARLSASVHSVN